MKPLKHKWLPMLLAITLVLSVLAGCASKDSGDDTPSPPKTSGGRETTTPPDTTTSGPSGAPGLPVPSLVTAYTEVMPPTYFSEGYFSEGLAGVGFGYEGDYKKGYIDKTGAEVIPFKYDSAGAFSDGLAAVELDGKWGYIDKTGAETAAFKYDFTFSFSEGLGLVKLDDKYGYMDKTGAETVPAKYDGANYFAESGTARVQLGEKWGVIDKTGAEIVPLIYDDASAFSEDVAAVSLDGKYGYADKTGAEVIPLKFEAAGSFRQGLAAAQMDGKYGYIDKKGDEVIPFIYDYAYAFSDGLAIVELDGKCGYINAAGKEVFPFKYDDAFAFSEGLASVVLNEKWGFIDKTGAEVVPPIYDDVRGFSEGLARVKLDNKYGFINTEGTVIVPLIYDGATHFLEGMAAVNVIPPDDGSELYSKWGLWGYISILESPPEMILPSPNATYRPETPEQSPKESSTPPSIPYTETLDYEQKPELRGNSYAELAHNYGSTAAWGDLIVQRNTIISIDGVGREYTEDDPAYLNIQGDTLYYCNRDDGAENEIWKINLDGTGKESVFKADEQIETLNLSDGWLYYTCYGNSGYTYFRVRIDGTKNKQILDSTPEDIQPIGNPTLCIGSNAIYYLGLGRTLCKAELDGSIPRRLCEDNLYNPPVLRGEWLYYLTTPDHETYTLYRIKTDGTERTEIFSGDMRHYDFYKDKLYYLTPEKGGDDNWLWALNDDGSGEPELIFKTESDDFASLSVVGDRIYIEGFWSNYVINADGSGARSNSRMWGGDFTPYP